MEIFGNLSINLISTLIGFLICQGYHILKKTYQVKITKYFWKPFADGNQSFVIIGHIKEFNDWERSGLIGFGDAVALAELKSYFDSMNIKSVAINYDNDIDKDALKSNLILIGGPTTNIITKKVLSNIHSTLKFEELSLAILDTKENKKYVPSVDRSGDDGVDYGLIIRAKNPFEKSKKVVVIAGSWGYGTWAGAIHSISTNFNEEIYPCLSFDSFECLVKSNIILGTPQNIETI